MSSSNHLSILIFTISMLVIDFIWIGTYMSNKYKSFFKSLKLKMVFRWYSALLTYLLMIASYVVFVDQYKNNIKEYLSKATILGVLLFGVYGFTLSSIFPKYNFGFAITETIWGGVLYALSAIITYNINKNYL